MVIREYLFFKKIFILILAICFITTAGFLYFGYYKSQEKSHEDLPNPFSSTSMNEQLKGKLLADFVLTNATVKVNSNLSGFTKTALIKNLDSTLISPDTETYEQWLQCITDFTEDYIGDSDYKEISSPLHEDGFLSELTLNADSKVAIYSQHCGYSDNIYFLKIYKNENLIREFTYLFGGLRFVNLSPDKTKIVFTGIKNPAVGNYTRDTFMYDFRNDKLTVLPNLECVHDQFHWVDNMHFATLKITPSDNLYNVDSSICVWDLNGSLIKSINAKLSYFMAYPGGLIFNGDIDLNRENNNLVIYAAKYVDFKKTICSVFFEDDGEFLEKEIVEFPYTSQTMCGNLDISFFYHEKKDIQLKITFSDYFLPVNLQ